MKSIWSKSSEVKQREHLTKDMSVKAVVIGGGMAGILISYYLNQRGIENIILEADRIGSGQTKNTTAKITAQHSYIYKKLIEEFGEEKALQYAKANLLAIEEYKRIILEKNIDCDFEELPAYIYSIDDEESMKEESEAAKKLGVDAEFTSSISLPFDVKGAVKFNNQAQFNPLKFLYKISEELIIYEHTKVKTIEDNKIVTEDATVTAEYIIFASHYPFINMPGYYFMRMHQERSYVIALKNACKTDGMYLGVDKDGLSFRNYGDTLLLGGGGHRTGENSKGGRYEMLRKAAAKYFPDSEEVFYWSAQDCITLDSMPYIGRFSSTNEKMFVATGFGKWGMTSSMVSAMIISDMIMGKKNPYEQVFSPQRFVLSASAKNMMDDGAQAVKGLTRKLFSPPREDIENIQNGHGAVVDYEGDKAGVYKDEKGEVFIVSIRCPHLGCQLEWNPDELSWDCPCHGSRFDYTGKLIDNPAQEDLGHE